MNYLENVLETINFSSKQEKEEFLDYCGEKLMQSVTDRLQTIVSNEEMKAIASANSFEEMLTKAVTVAPQLSEIIGEEVISLRQDILSVTS